MDDSFKKAWTLGPVALVLGLLVLLAGSASGLAVAHKAIAKDDVTLRPAFFFNPNNTPNPDVVLSCPDPVFTIALSIDRSDAINLRRELGGETQERIIKDSTKQFLDSLYNKVVLSHGGKVNVILNAVAMSSVNQNRVDGSGNKIVEINSDRRTLDAMQQDVENIYFGDVDTTYAQADPEPNPDTPGIIEGKIRAGDRRFASDPSDSSPSRYKYGYNPMGEIYDNYGASEDAKLHQNDVGKANFDDALLDVAKEASKPGQHVDMSLLLGSGIWDNWDHNDRQFDSRDDRRADWSWDRFDAAIKTVNALRSGTPVPSTTYGPRPPMAVRAIMYNTDFDTKNELEHVYGSQSDKIGYAYAQNRFSNIVMAGNSFRDELNAALQNVVDSIGFSGSCVSVVPSNHNASIKIELFESDGVTPLPKLLKIPEGTEHDIRIRITNTSSVGVSLFDINLALNGAPPFLNGIMLAPGDSYPDIPWTIKVKLGEAGQHLVFDTGGHTSLAFGNRPANDSATLDVDPGRDPLPS